MHMDKNNLLKKIKKFICSMVILIGISVLGEILHTYVPLPIPASVYGLVLLFVALVCKWIRLEWVETGADLLIAIMPLLFVPSVVKLVSLKTLVVENLVPLLCIIAISSVVVMVVTGKVSQGIIERRDKDHVK